MRRVSRVLVLAAVLALVGGCGGDDDDNVTAEGPTTTSTAEATTSTTAAAELTQPAIWPAAGVVFDEPEAAAEDFVETALGVPPVIGEFRAADSRSGEIEVYSAGEDGTRRILRSTLVLRQLGADDGWFIIAAVNPNASITEPQAGDEVAAGDVDVSGQARGFEANVVVSAFVAGHADQELDQEITQGGAFESPEPYLVTLGLSDAPAGATVVILVRGGTGLETDPGDFGAIPVVMNGG